MAHFAKVINGMVEDVIVIEQEEINSGLWGDPASWIRTSYNTRGGIHTQGKIPLRKNYAGIGFKYDPILDAFIPPRPVTSWNLNPDSCLWEAPVAYPKTGELYTWDEESLNWKLVVVSGE